MQGKGTFVAHPKISTRSPAYKGIREQLEGMGYAVATNVLANEIVPADEPVARALQIPLGEAVHDPLVRLIADGEPISLHTSYVPERLAPSIDADDLVSRAVRGAGGGPRPAHEQGQREPGVHAAQRPGGEGPQDPPDHLLLLLTHEIADPSGRLFEFSRILFRGDKLRLKFHYEL